MSPSPPDHQPFYCEENIHRLAQRGDLIEYPSEVVIITNPLRQVACWHQRAAEPDEPICWDYHVVLLEQHPASARIWDLDTRLPCPLPAELWVGATFFDPSQVRRPFHPYFRVVPSAVYLAELATDRSHMRTPAGRYRRPPPTWEPPGGTATNLESRWLDLTAHPEELMDRAGLLAHIAALGR